MDELVILSETIVVEQNSFKRVIQYVKGWHPELGKLTFGYTGKETIVEKTIVTPLFFTNIFE